MSGDGSEQSATDDDDRFLRVFVLVAICACTLLWLASFIPIIRVDRTRSDGFEAIPAFYATLIYMVLVVPAVLLRVFGGQRGLNGAAVMLVLAGIMAAFIFLR